MLLFLSRNLCFEYLYLFQQKQISTFFKVEFKKIVLTFLFKKIKPHIFQVEIKELVCDQESCHQIKKLIDFVLFYKLFSLSDPLRMGILMIFLFSFKQLSNSLSNEALRIMRLLIWFHSQPKTSPWWPLNYAIGVWLGF